MYDEKLYEKSIRDTFKSDYEEAHLSKLVFPEVELNKINEWSKSPKNILFMSGNPGVGKTYLCVCFCKYLIEKKKNFRCFNEKGFFSHLREGIKENIDPEYEIRRLCEAEYFILDDIGSAVNMTDWQIEQLFSFLDYRTASRLPTIMTSNLFLKDIKNTFSPRFLSRVLDKRNTVIELNWIDKRVEDF